MRVGTNSAKTMTTKALVLTATNETVATSASPTRRAEAFSVKKNTNPLPKATHPPYQKPELLATGPNQLWSWDITKLKGSAKWTYFYLYVILDVFSRYVVGW